MTRKALLPVAACAVALSVPAAGVSAARGGTLRMLAWAGYLQPRWVTPFERASGCRVQATYADSSDQMATLMRGGGRRFDLVSASGDVALRLIQARDVRPVDPSRIPDFRNFPAAFRSPPTTTVRGRHYGISLQWGPDALLYDASTVKRAPRSWAAVYSPKYAGKITLPDNPLQIADAALYLASTKPSLRISDPYELDQAQFEAAIALLDRQKPLVQSYWADASDEIAAFRGGAAALGAGWPYQAAVLRAGGTPVRSVLPKEGATAWLDSWMVSRRTRSLSCAYEWLAWVSTPKVQAEQALYVGETPVNAKACAWMDRLSKGSCEAYDANVRPSALAKIRFWRTPVARCDDGRSDCVAYARWRQAWAQLIG